MEFNWFLFPSKFVVSLPFHSAAAAGARLHSLEPMNSCVKCNKNLRHTQMPSNKHHIKGSSAKAKRKKEMKKATKFYAFQMRNPPNGNS